MGNSSIKNKWVCKRVFEEEYIKYSLKVIICQMQYPSIHIDQILKTLKSVVTEQTKDFINVVKVQINCN